MKYSVQHYLNLYSVDFKLEFEFRVFQTRITLFACLLLFTILMVLELVF